MKDRADIRSDVHDLRSDRQDIWDVRARLQTANAAGNVAVATFRARDAIPFFDPPAGTTAFGTSWIGHEFRLLHDDQDIAGCNGSAFGDGQGDHAARPNRLQLVLHFHRFDDNEALTGFNSIALGYQDANNFAWHWSGQCLFPFSGQDVRAAAGLAGIPYLDFESPFTGFDHDSISGSGDGSDIATAVEENGIDARLNAYDGGNAATIAIEAEREDFAVAFEFKSVRPSADGQLALHSVGISSILGSTYGIIPETLR